MEEPRRHLLQRLGRDRFEFILDHLKDCPSCIEELSGMYLDYQKNRGYPEVRDREITNLSVFLKTLHSARKINVPNTSRVAQ